MNINKTIFNLCGKAERGQRGTRKINMIITDIYYAYSIQYTVFRSDTNSIHNSVTKWVNSSVNGGLFGL